MNCNELSHLKHLPNHPERVFQLHGKENQVCSCLRDMQEQDKHLPCNLATIEHLEYFHKGLNN